MNRTLLLTILTLMLAALMACSQKEAPTESAEEAPPGIEAEKGGEAEPSPSTPTATRAPADSKPSPDPAPPAPAKADEAMGDGEADDMAGDFGEAEAPAAFGVSGKGVGGGGTGEGGGGRGLGRVGLGKGAGSATKAKRATAKPAPRGDVAAKDVPTRERKIRGPAEEIKMDDDKKSVEPPTPPTPSAGRLTAGEWRDLDNWEFWRGLFTSNQKQETAPWARMEEMWGYDTVGRVPVKVTREGRPVVDALVTLSDASQKTWWEARTDNRGQAWLFPGLFEKARGPYTVTVKSGAHTARVEQVRPSAEPVDVKMELSQAPSNALDVMFMVDTTGSMGDELRYLQAELGSVITQVQEKNGKQLAIRTSVNFYRDEGDEYVVRDFPFTKDLDAVLEQIKAQRASGGGDFPEAVEAALDNAVREHTWSESARARLLFLVLDAPPHHTPQIVEKLHNVTREAAKKGIQVIPLVGSGINKETEFLMRFVSVSTGGSYVFLTDHSGIGGGHVKPTIGPHKVELLNALLVKLINRSLG